jgi:hypothetical protein
MNDYDFDKEFKDTEREIKFWSRFLNVFIAIVFVLAIGGVILQFSAGVYLLTHPETIGHFFGSIVKGFNQ